MKKKLKILCSFTLCFLLLLVSGNHSYAVSSEGTSDDLSKSEQKDVNISISLLTEAPNGRKIACFDVNENGMVALLLANNFFSKNTVISVYDPDGNFQYGYSFKSYGSVGIEWNGDNLNIYFVRSDLVVTIDRESNILGAEEIPDTKENISHSYQYHNDTERVVGDAKYTIKNKSKISNLFSSSRTQLVKTTSDGTEKILYSVNAFQLVRTIIIAILGVVFFGAAAYMAFKRYKAEK